MPSTRMYTCTVATVWLCGEIRTISGSAAGDQVQIVRREVVLEEINRLSAEVKCSGSMQKKDDAEKESGMVIELL